MAITGLGANGALRPRPARHHAERADLVPVQQLHQRHGDARVQAADPLRTGAYGKTLTFTNAVSGERAAVAGGGPRTLPAVVVAVFGDAHGHAEALDAVLAAA